MSSLLSPLIMYDMGPLNHITTCQERLYLCLTELHRDKAQASVILSNLDVFFLVGMCVYVQQGHPEELGKILWSTTVPSQGGGSDNLEVFSVSDFSYQCYWQAADSIGVSTLPSRPFICNGLEFYLNVSCVLLLSLKRWLIHHTFPRHYILMLCG